MSLLGFLLRESAKAVALSALAGVVAGLSGVALIALIQARLGRDGGDPLALGLAFAALCLLAAATRVVSQAAMIRIGQRTVSKLAVHLCERLLALPLRRFEAIDPAATLAVLTEDVVIVAGALIAIPQLCINVPIVAASFAYIGWLSPVVLLCGLGFAGPAALANVAVSAVAVRRLKAARSGQDVLVGHFRALIEGFRELKIHRGRRASFLAEGLVPAASGVEADTVAGLTRLTAAASLGQVAFFGFLGFVLFVLPTFHPIDRRGLGGVTLAILYVMVPLDVVLAWLPSLGRARASLEKIHASVPAPSACEPDDPPAASAPAPFESLRLSGITYAYRDEPDGEGFLLGPIDLELAPGEAVFLAGGNGSGKTTFVKLLAGLYEPDSGTIALDGRPVGPADRESYRRLFSVLFADGYLFPDLRGLDPGPDPRGLDASAGELLGRLGLDGLVSVESGAFSTTALSQGQRRRLALLGALLEDRPICVFDEWAAHQDPHFKAHFYRELIPELKARGKALLVISHDEDYFSAADRLVKFHDGLIREFDPAVPVAVDEACPWDRNVDPRDSDSRPGRGPSHR